MKVCQYFEVKQYTWRGFRQTRGFRRKTGRAFKQLTPHDWTTFQWESTASFTHYASVVILLAVFLAAELNPFYLKSLLWMEPSHPIVVSRLIGVFLCALPAVRELYQYVHGPRYVWRISFAEMVLILRFAGNDRRAVRMGQHVWLLLATVGTENLIIYKWSRGMFTESFPKHIQWFTGITSFLLVGYPTLKVCIVFLNYP
jgi:phosphatidylserine synthase 2